MTKPLITKAQINGLIEKLDDACLGKTPFTCADSTSSDRLATQLHNVIHDYDAHRLVVELAICWAVRTKNFLVEKHMKEDGDPDITKMGAQELGILESIQTLWLEYQSRQ